MTPAPPTAPPANPPFWKNPWLIAFLLGMVGLTVLRFTQQKFLHAPAPGPSVGAWQLHTLEGAPYGSNELKGHVWISSFATSAEAHARFGSILKHIDDLPEPPLLVSFVLPGGTPPARPPGTEPRWVVLTGDEEQLDTLVLEHFRPAFVQFPPTVTASVDAGTTVEDFAQLGAFGVVDRAGALRGFWPDTDLGRGNVINAARLLAKKGDQP